MKNFNFDVYVKIYETDKRHMFVKENIAYEDITKTIKNLILYNTRTKKEYDCIKVKVTTRSGFIVYKQRFVVIDNKLVEFSSNIRREIEGIEI